MSLTPWHSWYTSRRLSRGSPGYIWDYMFINLGNPPWFKAYKSRGAPTRSLFVYVLHEHALINDQLLLLLCFAWLEMQPAKSCIMIAEVMQSTCSQLDIQSGLWFAHQIWFWEDLCDATGLFITTHCGSNNTKNSSPIWLVRSFKLRPVT